MVATPWTPWHKVVRLRDDLRSGELSLNIFAADLYDVAMGKAQRVYQDAAEFFALTYPTVALRDLARDVAERLAGRNDKAVRQLELTYGGGKTHTLITLYHLTHDPTRLPATLPTVQEFIQSIGQTPPQARIAVLAFDKLDVEKGMEITSPQGERRWLRQPWSVLAWQIAGADGLRILHPDDLAEERETAPAENLLTELLARPERDGLATLILIDEVLMYARGKVDHDPRWRDILANFFQYLTQAAVKAPRCAIVASLLATDPRKSDQLGKEIILDLQQVFTRQQEAPIQPVQKDDAAEVLRRRFFTPESLRDRDAFRPHANAAAKGIFDLDAQSARDRPGVEAQLRASYPFHPALTDIFYTKWTNLEGFQRTRGVLRTFALALRDAEAWDESPLVGAQVFLSRPGETGLAAGARELTNVAISEEVEGKRQNWVGILEGELAKAREIQEANGGLRYREIEQAVFATFLHSQPIGQRAASRDLYLLLGPTRPDPINLNKALLEWSRTSWFLDETALEEGRATAAAGGDATFPRFWRLGSKPNLRQMHHDARDSIIGEVVEEQLLNEIGRVATLKRDANGVRLHLLPKAPSDVQDDGEFHFALLGPGAASPAGRPSAEAQRYLNQTTGENRPRVYKNALILAVPSTDGLDAARSAIRDALAWQEVQARLKQQGEDIDPIRSATLTAELSAAQKRIPDVIRQAYCIVVTMGSKGAPDAFKVTPNSNEGLFTTIKADKRTRIVETAVSAEALLPGGPYDLWRADEPTRRVKDLIGAFAQYPHLPKMLNTQAIEDTLVAGCRDGALVLQLPRPDHSYRTFWREPVDLTMLREPSFEATLPATATLTALAPALLAPGALPALWRGDGHGDGQGNGQSEALTFAALVAYFAGGNAVKVQRDGYTEDMATPRADRQTLASAVEVAVREGVLWLVAPPTSLYREDVPAGVLTDATQFYAPPAPIRPQDILAPNLPAAWQMPGATTARAIADALAAKAGKPLPWSSVSQAISGAFNARYLERAPDSGAWPCDAGGAANVRVQTPQAPAQVVGAPSGAVGGAAHSASNIAESPVAFQPLAAEAVRLAGSASGQGGAMAELSVSEVQELAEQVGELKRIATAIGASLHIHAQIALEGGQPLTAEKLAEFDNALRAISPRLRFPAPALTRTPE